MEFGSSICYGPKPEVVNGSGVTGDTGAQLQGEEIRATL